MRGVTAGSDSVLELLPMVFAAPGEALAGAREVLDGDPTPFRASVAHHVIGIWQRDFGDIRLALHHLRRARDLAARADSAEREADVLGTLGVALVHAGRTRQGLEAFERGIARGTGRPGRACCTGGRTSGGCWAGTPGTRGRTTGNCRAAAGG